MALLMAMFYIANSELEAWHHAQARAERGRERQRDSVGKIKAYLSLSARRKGGDLCKIV